MCESVRRFMGGDGALGLECSPLVILNGQCSISKGEIDALKDFYRAQEPGTLWQPLTSSP